MAALRDPEKLIPVLVQIALTIVAIRYTVETRRLRIQNQDSLAAVQDQLKLARAQLQHASAFDLISLSNKQNWYLLDAHNKLPAALPHWIGLTDTGWAWRILHLNHLNLLKLAYDDYQNGLIDNSRFDGWVKKGRFWFRNLSNREEGRQRMKELMQPEEGHPREFCDWLVQSEIVPKDLMAICMKES